MHIKFLKIICDPETKENLKLVYEKKKWTIYIEWILNFKIE